MKMYSRHNQKGATLIEAMVSVVIFSIGALGLAALQLSSLTISGDTKQRSLVVWKAQELSDRMRSTKNENDPDGALPKFLELIDNDDDGIGVFTGNEFTCPAVPARRCADYRNASGTLVNGANCNADQLAEFDLWDVLCEPSSGLSPTAAAVDVNESDTGVVGVQNLEVAMQKDGDDYLLYFEWLSRAADNNQTDSEGAGSDSLSGNVTAELCGNDVLLDYRVEAYCVRIR